MVRIGLNHYKVGCLWGEFAVVMDKPMVSDDKKLVEILSEEVHKAYCRYKKEVRGENYWTNGNYSLLEDEWKEADRYTVRAVLDYLQRICRIKNK